MIRSLQDPENAATLPSKILVISGAKKGWNHIRNRRRHVGSSIVFSRVLFLPYCGKKPTTTFRVLWNI
jgi:hypothetical protein